MANHVEPKWRTRWLENTSINPFDVHVFYSLASILFGRDFVILHGNISSYISITEVSEYEHQRIEHCIARTERSSR